MPFEDVVIIEQNKTDIDLSKESLQKAFKIRPDLKNEVLPETANFIPYHIKSNSGVSFFEFQKIRKILYKMTVNYGWKTKRHCTITFFDLLMVWIPYNSALDWSATIHLWDNPRPAFNQARLAKFSLGYEHYRWRYLVLKQIPNDYVNIFLGIIPPILPFQMFIDLWSQFTLYLHPIFESLSTYSQLSDHILCCNWDKILKILNHERWLL